MTEGRDSSVLPPPWQLLLPSHRQALKQHSTKTVVPQKLRLPPVKLDRKSPVPLKRAQSFYQCCWLQLLSLSHSLLARDDRVPAATHVHLLFSVLSRDRYGTQAQVIQVHHRCQSIYRRSCDQVEVFFPLKGNKQRYFFPQCQKELKKVRNRPETLKMVKADSKNHLPAQPEQFLTKPF